MWILTYCRSIRALGFCIFSAWKLPHRVWSSSLCPSTLQPELAFVRSSPTMRKLDVLIIPDRDVNVMYVKKHQYQCIETVLNLNYISAASSNTYRTHNKVNVCNAYAMQVILTLHPHCWVTVWTLAQGFIHGLTLPERPESERPPESPPLPLCLHDIIWKRRHSHLCSEWERPPV